VLAAGQRTRDLAGENQRLAEDQAKLDKDAAEQAADAEKERADAKKALYGDSLSAASQFADAGIELAKKAGLSEFNAEKIAAVKSIALNSISAGMAWSVTMVPVGIALAAGLGAIQAGLALAVSPPSYHVGGLVSGAGMLPDEQIARVRKGEPVLPAGSLSEDEVNRIRRGEGAGSSSLVVVQQYQHKAFGTFVQDNIKQPNAPLGRAIRTVGGRVGHRKRS
jgi:hypothetical protein